MIFWSVIFVKSLQQFLYNLYLFQLKEYRTDRVKEHLERQGQQGIGALLYLTIFTTFSFNKLPKPTLKAILYTIFEIAFFVLVYEIDYKFLGIVFIFTTPFHILLADGIIKPIEWSIRHIVYEMARLRVASLQKNNNLVTIGITGSYGKTTTKYFLYQLLGPYRKTLTTAGGTNTPLSTAFTILKELTPEHKIFIAEMGAYKKGEIRQLCNIVRPTIGIVTGIGPQHLSLFGSIKNIIATKSELLSSLPPGGSAFVNKDSKYKAHIPTRLNVLYYNEASVGKLFGRALRAVPIPKYLKINIIPAIFVAQKIGVSGQQIIRALRPLQTPGRRMRSTRGYREAQVIDDSYSSNPDGFLSAINHLASLNYHKKIVVMACIIELGNQAKIIHRRIGAKLRQFDFETIVTTKDYYKEVSIGAKESNKVVLISNPGMVKDSLSKKVDKNTVVLIEGRVNKQVVNFLKNAT